MWKLTLALLVCLPLSLQAQTVIPIDTLPVVLSVTWDDDSSEGERPTSYEVTLDVQPPIVVLPAKPSPCVDCATASITVATLGAHTVTIRGRNTAGLGPPGTQPFSITYAVVIPRTPLNITLRVPPPPATTPSPPGTNVPPAATIIASDLAVWSLSAPLPNPITACPGTGILPANCRSLLRNNVEVGRGYEEFVAANMMIWARGYEGLWYRWGGTTLIGPGQPTKPQ